MLTKKNLLVLSGVLIAITFILDLIFIDRGHPHFWWEAIPGFDLIFGFVGCVVIIIVSKKIGKYWIQRDERYYGGEE